MEERRHLIRKSDKSIQAKKRDAKPEKERETERDRDRKRDVKSRTKQE